MLRDALQIIIESIILEQYNKGGLGKKSQLIINALNGINDLSKIKNIIETELNLKLIGRGSFRLVYEIDEDCVLKVSRKGRLSNHIESNPKLVSILGEYIPKIYARGKRSEWIIVEKCSPVLSAKDWLNNLGFKKMQYLHELKEAINILIYLKSVPLDLEEERIKTINHINNTPYIKEFSESDFCKKIMLAKELLNFNPIDFRVGNVGYGKDGRSVLLDFGMPKFDPKTYPVFKLDKFANPKEKYNNIIESIILEQTQEWVYHIAPASNVESIAEEGIVAGRGATFAGGSYRNYSKGWNFFTEADGVNFWFSRVKDHVEYSYDPDNLANYFPVLLRMPISSISGLESDEVGSKDACAKAHKTQDSIDPEVIQFWNGSNWLPVESFSIEEELERGVIVNSEWVSDDTSDDGTESGYANFTFKLPGGWR